MKDVRNMLSNKSILLLLVMLFGMTDCQIPFFNVQLSTIHAQNSKKVKDLKNQKAKLQQELKKSQQALDKTKKDVKDGQQNIQYLDREIEVRVRYIHQTEDELDSLERLVDSVKYEIHVLDSILTAKKNRYTQALRMAEAYRKVQNPLLFALSARNVTQMYRRLRYTRQYASFQRALGEDVQAKQIELLERQNRLLALKAESNEKMRILIDERAKLNRQQVEQKNIVQNLQKRQKGLQKEVADKQNRIVALQKKIDEVVAYEIEQARKRAEEERRRREAEAKRKAAAEAAKKKQSGQSGTTTTTPKTSAPANNGRWISPEDQRLEGNFVQNKGRLPVPITGQYMIGALYGSNTSVHSNVVLTCNGVNYVGRQGARARTVFDGEVTRVVDFGGVKIVLVRHGSYISVYSGLSSVIVQKGQRLKARDLIGTIGQDDSGQYVLHFQLRKEKALLNPEQWVGR